MAKKDREQTKKGMDDLFAASGSDLVSEVIAGDRLRSGRSRIEEVENYDNMTSHNVIKQYGNKTSQPVRGQASRAESPPAGKQTKALPKTAKTAAAPRSKPGQDATLVSRVETATKMAHSPTMTVTLRLPREMNDWLDAYVHGAWPVRIKKQELVVEGLRLLIARRGNPQEEFIETDLLPEEEGQGWGKR